MWRTRHLLDYAMLLEFMLDGSDAELFLVVEDDAYAGLIYAVFHVDSHNRSDRFPEAAHEGSIRQG